MNDLVIDRRVFLQTKKKNQARSLLPEIKYPANFNINGSNILRRINQETLSKEPPFRQRPQYQPPLSNILISKRITPGNPEDSPHNNNRKKQNVSLIRRDSSNKLVIQPDIRESEGPRKTSTSLSQRVRRRNHQKTSINVRQQQKCLKLNKNEEYSVVFGKGNNNQELIKQILLQRKIWRQVKWGQCTPHLKWVFNKDRHNYKKMWSFTQTRAINHFQFNDQISTKDNLIRNLQIFCETRKIQIFTVTPITFIVDFDDEYCQYNMKQFLSFFNRNDPRKNNASPTRRNNFANFPFVNKFQPYMAWQNSDIKKKVNILSRPVNNSTYYSPVEDGGEPSYIWIFKPTGLNRGRGIQIFDSLQQLQKILLEYLVMMNRKSYKDTKQKNAKKGEKEKQVDKQKIVPMQESNELAETNEDTQQQKFCTQKFKLSTCSFVIQKYVERPFLIDKRKFDIRVWVLLTHSMDLYFFKEGYIRTSTQEFSVKDIDNYFIHLTNNAIQKNSSTYGRFENGNQLSFKDLAKFIGEEQTDKIWAKMKESTHMVFSSVKKKINQNSRRFCFELFGMDFIVDSQLKTWLIEVNQNPCLECSSPLLGQIIPRMINDGFKLTVDQIFSDKKPIQKVYPVKGYSDSENLWEHMGQLLPKAEFSPQKQMPFKI